MIYFLLIISLFGFLGCEQKPQERHYTEVMIKSPLNETAPVTSAVVNGLAWHTPADWSQEPGNAMRMATFHLSANPEAIDCSIVSLGGMAGGLGANLKRWMKQINIQASPDEFDQFVNSAKSTTTQTGSQAKIFDFTQLQKNSESSSKSMIAAMITIHEATVFVKMTGSMDAINKNKDNFMSLVKSIHSK